MRVKFTRDTDHEHSPRSVTAYKADKTYTVPSEFGEACIEDGSAIAVKGRKRKAPQTQEDDIDNGRSASDETTENGDGS